MSPIAGVERGTIKAIHVTQLTGPDDVELAEVDRPVPGDVGADRFNPRVHAIYRLVEAAAAISEFDRRLVLGKVLLEVAGE